MLKKYAKRLLEGPKGVPGGPQKGPEREKRAPGGSQECPGDPNMTPLGPLWG